MIARATASAAAGRLADRVFLDANVLFSASYRSDSALARLWRGVVAGVTLLSSPYAIEEAKRNLQDLAARERLETLVATIDVVSDVATGELPPDVKLPQKDVPVLLATIAADATHLLTGDRAHFGAYFGRRIAGVLIQRPGNYLARRR